MNRYDVPPNEHNSLLTFSSILLREISFEVAKNNDSERSEMADENNTNRTILIATVKRVDKFWFAE